MKPKQNSEIMMKNVGGESLLYKANDKSVHVLNPTAKLIWKLCDGQHDLTEIVKAVQSNFSVPENHDVMADVQQVIETMASKGLLSKN